MLGRSAFSAGQVAEVGWERMVHGDRGVDFGDIHLDQHTAVLGSTKYATRELASSNERTDGPTEIRRN